MGDGDAVKPTVLFKAPVLTQSGYGVHARQIACVLLDMADRGEIDLHVEPVRWGNTPWFVSDDAAGGLVGRVRRYIKPHVRDVKFTATVQLLLPNEWTPVQGAVNIGITAAVESDRMNPLWLPAVNAMDVVIVPTHHTEKVIRSAGHVTTELVVIPESYTHAIQDRQCVGNVSTFLDKLETKFNFLVVGQVTSTSPALDRKNIFGTLKCICDAFRTDDQVGIVLKTNMGRNTRIDRKNAVNYITTYLRESRRGTTPRVHLLHGDMSDAEVATLYSHDNVKALVSLTRGEGFGLPLLEAAASGLPVIATDWGGHLDFMNLGRFIKVRYTLQAIPAVKVDHAQDERANIWMQDSRWAQPDEQNAVNALKRFRQSPDIPKTWAVDLASEIRRTHSPRAIAMLYTQLFTKKFLEVVS